MKTASDFPYWWESNWQACKHILGASAVRIFLSRAAAISIAKSLTLWKCSMIFLNTLDFCTVQPGNINGNVSSHHPCLIKIFSLHSTQPWWKCVIFIYYFDGGWGSFSTHSSFTIMKKNTINLSVNIYFFYSDWNYEVTIRWVQNNTVVLYMAFPWNGGGICGLILTSWI